MNIRPTRIALAHDRLSDVQLNDAERLRVAEQLIEQIFALVNPMTDPQMCIAEGYLASASHAVEQAKLLVEGWPQDSLPFDPDLEPENQRAPEQAPCRTCGYALAEYGCDAQRCRQGDVRELSDLHRLRVLMVSEGRCPAGCRHHDCPDPCPFADASKPQGRALAAGVWGFSPAPSGGR